MLLLLLSGRCEVYPPYLVYDCPDCHLVCLRPGALVSEFLLLTLHTAEVSTGYTLPSRCNLHFFNFRHSGTLALSPERQSTRMSEIKNVG